MAKMYGNQIIDGLSEEDVVRLRLLHHEGAEVSQLAEEMKISEDVVERALDGEIMLLAEGPLRPLPLQGVNPNVGGLTRNRVRFMRGVLRRAKAIMTREQFKTFAKYNGLAAEEADRIVYNSEDLNEELTQQRYRGVLHRHARGASIEEALAEHAQRITRR